MNRRFDSLSFIDRAALSVLIAASAVLIPLSANAQVSNQKQIVFEIKNLSTITIPLNYQDVLEENNSSPEELEALQEQIFQSNVATLQAYLTQKGSPLANYSDVLLKQDNWKLIIAISNGESTMCKHYAYNNCWGIGGAWNLKRYKDLGEGITDVNRILTTKYVADGLDTPEEMVRRYVGHPNTNWVLAANKILAEVNQLPLVN